MEIKLPKSMMAFKITDGSFIYLHEEDVKAISMQIVAEACVSGKNIILTEKDRSIEKANFLYDVLKNQKDIDPDVRKKYLLQIGQLLESSDKQLIELGTDKEYKEQD